MLLGEFEHALDEKGRLTLPAKFRESFAEGLVVTRGLDGCLYAYRRADWDRLIDSQLATLDPLKKEGRRLHRFFFAGAAETDLDKQGRVMLPAALIAHAHLRRHVVVAGVRDHLEIWDRAAWRQETAAVEGDAEHVAEQLATRRQ
jgi:MraZ protein